jgi:DUF917 family protein
MNIQEVVTKKRFTKKDAESIARVLIEKMGSYVLITDYPYKGHDNRYEKIKDAVVALGEAYPSDKIDSYGYSLRVSEI